MTNRNYGRLTAGQVEYALDYIVKENGGVICNPTAEQYLAAGWKTLHLAYPTDPAGEGKHWEEDGYDETATDITRKWKTVADPTVYRQFSKLKIYGAISGLDTANSAATWAKVQAWLEGKTVNGMNGWLAFQLAQEISEDHPLFAALAEEARVLLGLTAEQFEALLAQCVLEG